MDPLQIKVYHHKPFLPSSILIYEKGVITHYSALSIYQNQKN